MGRAVEISNGSAYTEIWYTQLGKTAYMNGSTINYAYVPAPGGGTALISGNGSSFSYLHKDWLGNSRITSDVVARTVTADQAFAPYGEIYDQFGSTATKYQMFTGDTQDIVAGMMDTPNREYNSAAEGRWLSPDPAGAGWNLYAYSTNPNTFIDPTGLEQCVGPMASCFHGSNTNPGQGFSGSTGSSVYVDSNGILSSSPAFGTVGADGETWSGTFTNADGSVTVASYAEPNGSSLFTTVSTSATVSLPTALDGTQTDYIGFGTLFGVLQSPFNALMNYLNKPIIDMGPYHGGMGVGVGDAPTWVTVGRWMSPEELAQMQASGQVVESNLNGVTSVTYPPNPQAYQNAPPGDVYVEFDVPSSSLYSGGEGWGKIYGPSSVPYGEYYGITEMPNAINILEIPVP